MRYGKENVKYLMTVCKSVSRYQRVCVLYTSHLVTSCEPNKFLLFSVSSSNLAHLPTMRGLTLLKFSVKEQCKDKCKQIAKVSYMHAMLLSCPCYEYDTENHC